MADVRTSRSNFVNRSRELVQKFYPFLEFVGEQALMAALIGSEEVDLTAGDGQAPLLAQQVAASFQSFQSGGQLAAEFLADVLRLIRTGGDDDAPAQDGEVREILLRSGFALGRESIDAILEASQPAQDAGASGGEEGPGDDAEAAERAGDILARSYVGSKFGLYAPVAGTRFDIFKPSGGSLTASTEFLRGDPRFEQRVQQELERDRAYVVARAAANTQVTNNQSIEIEGAERSALARAEARVRRAVARSFGGLRGADISGLQGFSPMAVNTRLLDPDPDNAEVGPNLVAVLINDVDLMPANRDTGISELFMNFIPSVEMSRAVPFLDVSLCTRERVDDREVSQVTSLAETLGLVDTLTRSTEAGTPGSDTRLDGTPNLNVATGIELFTSPQTLTTTTRFRELDELGTRPAAKNPLDPFRPPASLSGLNISVVSAGAGLISHKSAKMTITVHDRGRLSDFAHFIKPELYSSTHLLIEYGWSHPDGAEDGDIDQNPFGYLINSLRAVEKYTITGSSFSLGESGEVKIDIDLFARGSEALGLSDISRGEGVEPIIEQIDAVVREINDALSGLSRSGADVSEIFSSQILGSITSTDSSVTGRTDDFNEALASFLAQTSGDNNNPSISGIRARLVELYGENPTDEAESGPLLNQLRATITASLERKNRMLGNGIDPFLVPGSLQQLSSAARRGTFSADPLATPSSEFVSLGKLLMIYLGRPLAATKKFKEVQFVFYPFNDKASNVYRYSTANFPIRKQAFVDALARETRLSANLPIDRFGAMINREFIANQASEAYGFSNLYQPADADGRREVVEELEGQQTKIAGLKQELLKRIYGGDAEEAVFNMPSVTLYPEPVYIQRPEEASDGRDGRGDMFDTILRVHVFDQRASGKESALQIYQAALSSRIGAIRRPRVQRDDMGHQAAARRLVDAAVEDGVLELGPAAGDGQTDAEAAIPTTYRVAGGAAGVKRFMRRLVPTIRYGTQGSAALNASFQSNSDALMATAHILNAQSGQDGPPGAADGGLPLRISPATVSMTTIGFPWFNYGQQFFVDFDTGTTADNVYGITSVQHSIAPGEFKTELSLVPVSDAYGAYRSLSDDIANALQVLTDADVSNGDNDAAS